jgi:hypothetical protein
MKTQITFTMAAMLLTATFAAAQAPQPTPTPVPVLELQRELPLVQGLNRPGWQMPRDLHPFRTGFFDRFPQFGRGDFDDNFFLRAGHGPNDFNGTPESIDRGEPRFRHPTDGILDPELLRARGRDIRDRGIGVGQRAWGVGTGSGNQYAGIGAYNFGTSAGVGLLYQGLGDYYAGQGRYYEGVGAHNHANSLANINNEEAEERDIRNDEYHAMAFFNKRKMNLAHREYEDNTRPGMLNRLSTEQLYNLSKERAPDRLKVSDHDALTGTINWPTVFDHPRYDDAKAALDELFARRQRFSERSGLGSQNYREVRDITQAVERDLQTAMNHVTPMEYVAAKNFLRSLEYEAQMPVSSGRDPLAADLR